MSNHCGLWPIPIHDFNRDLNDCAGGCGWDLVPSSKYAASISVDPLLPDMLAPYSTGRLVATNAASEKTNRHATTAQHVSRTLHQQ